MDKDDLASLKNHLAKKSSSELHKMLDDINDLFNDPNTDASKSTWQDWTFQYNLIEELLIDREDT